MNQVLCNHCQTQACYFNTKKYLEIVKYDRVNVNAAGEEKE